MKRFCGLLIILAALYLLMVSIVFVPDLFKHRNIKKEYDCLNNSCDSMRVKVLKDTLKLRGNKK